MISARSIRAFLIRQPHPAAIRLTLRGDVTQTMRPSRGQSWARIAESVYEMSPELIECLDAEDVLLRAIRPQQSAELAEAPEPPPAISSDPETARITHFANLIHRAYEHSTVVAFAKMAEIVERMVESNEATQQRLAAIEARYHRQVQANIDDQFAEAHALLEHAQAASEEGDGQNVDLGQFLSAFAGGAQQRRRARSNGKGGDA